ncbi:hypothetical protein [Cypionkella sp.]|uniref:hypothetical protein n=1 Tax=Cypionkella sp. TaxID=2811411 RepID=UPI002ABCAEF6|nr:hypothetical protein [Cypionkella sp.]MDZ4394777.1 hypothetical protein [Cypionkella sp.]
MSDENRAEKVDVYKDSEHQEFVTSVVVSKMATDESTIQAAKLDMGRQGQDAESLFYVINRKPK